jgi:hypothetical protein
MEDFDVVSKKKIPGMVNGIAQVVNDNSDDDDDDNNNNKRLKVDADCAKNMKCY